MEIDRHVKPLFLSDIAKICDRSWKKSPVVKAESMVIFKITLEGRLILAILLSEIWTKKVYLFSEILH